MSGHMWWDVIMYIACIGLAGYVWYLHEQVTQRDNYINQYKRQAAERAALRLYYGTEKDDA